MRATWVLRSPAFDIKHPKMEIPLLALLFIGKCGAASMVTGSSAPYIISKMSVT